MRKPVKARQVHHWNRTNNEEVIMNPVLRHGGSGPRTFAFPDPDLIVDNQDIECGQGGMYWRQTARLPVPHADAEILQGQVDCPNRIDSRSHVPRLEPLPGSYGTTRFDNDSHRPARCDVAGVV